MLLVRESVCSTKRLGSLCYSIFSGCFAASSRFLARTSGISRALMHTYSFTWYNLFRFSAWKTEQVTPIFTMSLYFKMFPFYRCGVLSAHAFSRDVSSHLLSVALLHRTEIVARKFSSLKLHLADKNQHKELKTHKNPQNIHWKLNMHTSRASILCLLPSLSFTHAFVLSVFFALSHTLFTSFTYIHILPFFPSLSLPLTNTLHLALSPSLHLVLSPFLFISHSLHSSLPLFEISKLEKYSSSLVRPSVFDE